MTRVDTSASGAYGAARPNSDAARAVMFAAWRAAARCSTSTASVRARAASPRPSASSASSSRARSSHVAQSGWTSAPRMIASCASACAGSASPRISASSLASFDAGSGFAICSLSAAARRRLRAPAEQRERVPPRAQVVGEPAGLAALAVHRDRGARERLGVRRAALDDVEPREPHLALRDVASLAELDAQRERGLVIRARRGELAEPQVRVAARQVRVSDAVLVAALGEARHRDRDRRLGLARSARA